MIYLKWLLISLVKLPLLLTVPLAAVLISLFTRPDFEEKDIYKWGSLWGTFDNPPQGERAWVNKNSPFIGHVTGIKGYINRVLWMIRNPLYGFTKVADVSYDSDDVLHIKGNPGISDKYKIPGWVFATLRDRTGKLKAFEWYSVTPWSKNRNLRIRIGWKIKTDKMQERGWARHVVTLNPFDGYGKSEDR